MKKLAHVTNKLMRLSIYMFATICCTATTILAEDTEAQAVLEKKISIHIEGEFLKEALDKLAAKIDVSFNYVNNPFLYTEKVYLWAQDRQVKDILDELLEPRQLTYKVYKDNIFIQYNAPSSLEKLTMVFGGRETVRPGIRYPEELLLRQSGTVSGTVTDGATGEPLPGVTIAVKGTAIGTPTDLEGKFSLELPVGLMETGVLEVTFMGYQPQEIPVQKRREINIILQQDIAGLEQVVVVGYGTQKKSEITGAISSIKGEELTRLATQRVDQALQGRAAGVMVLNTDGAPGGNTTVRIRGMNSIMGGNNALIVIDGFQGGDLRSLNPNDIASIEVLKDASATAIYGAQGANGVILIQTKQGLTEKPSINFSTEFGASRIMMGGIEMMSAADFARETNLLEMANNLDRDPVPIFSEEEIRELERTGGTNWIDEIYRTGSTQTHQLSLSGKTNNISYFVSGSMLNQQGILINSGFKRYSLRANVSTKINDWLDAGVNWAGSLLDKNGAAFGSGIDWPANPITGAMVYSPTLPVYNAEDGSYSHSSNLYGDPIVWNPVASATEPDNQNKATQNTLNIFTDFKIAEGLSLRLTGGARIINETNTEFYNNKTFIGLQANGIGRAANPASRDYQTSNILTYNRQIDKHSINALLVGELKYSRSYNFSVNNSAFTIHETGFYNLGAADIQRTSSEFSERKITSGLFKLNYGFDDRYLFTFSYRADGSSVFGANNKWAYFPSASVGWRLSEENFIRELGVFDNLMLRTSWGKTGNQAIGTYQTLSRIGGGGFYPWDGGESTNIGFIVSSASNPDLKWETTRQVNVGMDVALFSGRLRFTAEYYDKVTEDLLMARELPRTTGLSSIIDNVGSMGNKGWEFTVDGDVAFNEFTWSIGASMSASRTKVLDLGEDDFLSYAAGGSGHGTNIPFMFLRVGQPFGQIMGFGYDGTWKTTEADEAARYGQMPGDPKYTDVNGDGKIDYDNDWKVIGNTLPDFIFGFNSSFSYKNWELAFLVQGAYGNDIFNVARIKRETGVGYGIKKLDRWTPENQDTDVPALIDQKSRLAYRDSWNASHPDDPFLSTISFPTSGSQVNSRWIENGSYLRMKNIMLSYGIPVKKYFRTLRIHASCTNLFTITKYSGFDPEVSSYTGNDAQLGTDYNSYPQSRTFNIGLTATL